MVLLLFSADYLRLWFACCLSLFDVYLVVVWFVFAGSLFGGIGCLTVLVLVIVTGWWWFGFAASVLLWLFDLWWLHLLVVLFCYLWWLGYLVGCLLWFVLWFGFPCAGWVGLDTL